MNTHTNSIPLSCNSSKKIFTWNWQMKCLKCLDLQKGKGMYYNCEYLYLDTFSCIYFLLLSIGKVPVLVLSNSKLYQPDQWLKSISLFVKWLVGRCRRFYTPKIILFLTHQTISSDTMISTKVHSCRMLSY